MSGNQCYHALAASVRFKDITSSAHNRALLHRIRNNDRQLKYLCIASEEDVGDGEFVVREEDDLGWLGYFVGENTTLTALEIAHFHFQGDSGQFVSFFKGVSNNKSIRTAYFTGDNIANEDEGEGLSAINMPNVTSVNVYCQLRRDCARSFAFGLRHCKSLENYGGWLTASIIDTLGELPMIESICSENEVDDNTDNFSKSGCDALENLLKNATRLTTLDLDSVGIGDEGMTSLAAGLVHNTSLKECSLSFNNIGDEGVEVLAVSLSINRSMRKLNLSENNITDVGIASLASLLVNNTGICELDISDNRLGNTAITEVGFSALSRALQSRKCKLESLDLSRLNLRSTGLELLGIALSINKSIVSLRLRCGGGSISMDNDGLRALTAGLRDNDTLQSLDLSGNTAINATGLRHLKQYFWSETCALQFLHLYIMHIGDGGAFALADALTHNKSLKHLLLSLNHGITAVGRNAFSKLLCDPTSASSIYLSNHTLEMFCWEGANHGHATLLLLGLNINTVCNSRSVAAKLKILYCFPDLDMTPLFQWSLKLLPFVKDWFRTITFSPSMRSSTSFTDWDGMAANIQSRELSAIYKFVSGMPGLVVRDYRRYVNQQLQMIQATKCVKEVQDYEEY